MTSPLSQSEDSAVKTKQTKNWKENKVLEFKEMFQWKKINRRLEDSSRATAVLMDGLGGGEQRKEKWRKDPSVYGYGSGFLADFLEWEDLKKIHVCERGWALGKSCLTGELNVWLFIHPSFSFVGDQAQDSLYVRQVLCHWVMLKSESHIWAVVSWVFTLADGSVMDTGSWKPVYRQCLKPEGCMKLGRKSMGRRWEPRNISREGVEGDEVAQEWSYLGSSYFFPS